MRLWHEDLIPFLPRRQLLGQHHECCALRGNGWGKPHSTVNYVFAHSRMALAAYHCLVIDEMDKRGYTVDTLWRDPSYRGKSCPADEPLSKFGAGIFSTIRAFHPVYPEHNEEYYKECLDSLAKKGINLGEYVCYLEEEADKLKGDRFI